MLKDIVEARALDGHKAYLRFEDGVEGVVDLGRLIRFEGVFAPLRDPVEFAQIDSERGNWCDLLARRRRLDPDMSFTPRSPGNGLLRLTRSLRRVEKEHLISGSVSLPERKSGERKRGAAERHVNSWTNVRARIVLARWRRRNSSDPFYVPPGRPEPLGCPVCNPAQPSRFRLNCTRKCRTKLPFWLGCFLLPGDLSQSHCTCCTVAIPALDNEYIETRGSLFLSHCTRHRTTCYCRSRYTVDTPSNARPRRQPWTQNQHQDNQRNSLHTTPP